MFFDLMIDNKKNNKCYCFDYFFKDQKVDVQVKVVEIMGESVDNFVVLVVVLNVKFVQVFVVFKEVGVCDFFFGEVGEWIDFKLFNMMFCMIIGLVVDEESYGYLCFEIVQGIFINFKNVVDLISCCLFFGIVQIGKVFCNEIMLCNFIFWVCELEQMEIEFFVMFGIDEEWYEYWLEKCLKWWEDQGVLCEKIEILDVLKEDFVYYFKCIYDLMYDYFMLGYEEIEGIVNCFDYDFGLYIKLQSELGLVVKVEENNDFIVKLIIFYFEMNKLVVLFVIELLVGVDWVMLVVLSEVFIKEMLENGNEWIVLKLKLYFVLIKVVVILLVCNWEEIMDVVKVIKVEFQGFGLGWVLYEDFGNIGKVYCCYDEVGMFYCVIVDFDIVGLGENMDESLKDIVIVCDCDMFVQECVKISELVGWIQVKLC